MYSVLLDEMLIFLQGKKINISSKRISIFLLIIVQKTKMETVSTLSASTIEGAQLVVKLFKTCTISLVVYFLL